MLDPIVAQPSLADALAEAARRWPGPASVAALADALAAELGPAQVSTVEAARRAASTDFAWLSPLLPAALPDQPADVVAYPRTTAELVAAVRLAHRHQVPVTPRGIGSGNYGQAVPLARGLVVDLSRCDRVLDAGVGWIRAEAGATFVALEAAARRTGQEVAMLPTTVGSTIGGFLAGGAGGVGSIEHGFLWDGFVIALDVVTCPPHAGPVAVSGSGCGPYLHAYGVTGIIATATVRLVPARDWVAVLASFPAAAGDLARLAGLELLRQQPAPRLLSVDEPRLVATYPADPAMPADRFSVRAVVDSSMVAVARRVVEAHDGRVEQVRPDGSAYLTSLSFNHVTLRARRRRPELCHLQVAGEALVSRSDEVRAVLPETLMHLDGLRTVFDPADPTRGRHYGGLLLSAFHDARTLYTGASQLRELGVHVVDPHTWLLGGPALPAIRDLAVANDPDGLLNPGKLPLPSR
ncbi:MAG TPA: FAD-binding oxidoreductase [Micromonosporaceae bacterium]